MTSEGTRLITLRRKCLSIRPGLPKSSYLRSPSSCRKAAQMREFRRFPWTMRKIEDWLAERAGFELSRPFISDMLPRFDPHFLSARETLAGKNEGEILGFRQLIYGAPGTAHSHRETPRPRSNYESAVDSSRSRRRR